MFRRETGALIDGRGFIWDIIIGCPASLLYPDEKIWRMSRFAQKIILAHTHPEYVANMSSEDESTLRAWSYALPNRIEMWIICKVHKHISVELNRFEIEPLQSWISRGKVGERKMELKTRSNYCIRIFRKPWINKLLEISYASKR